MSEERTNRLGEYLRARRGLVTPERAGLPGGGNRRVPGLRREEVALLAGISGDYYLRLERGRDKNPSAQVLGAIARVLQLDDLDHEYLLGLATTRATPRRRPRPERVPARLHHLLDSVQVPAFVEGRAFDVLAANDLALAFSPRLRPGNNRLRSLMLDPEEREFHQNWEAATEGLIAALRGSVGDEVENPRFVELVGELALTSDRFRDLWGRHDVRTLEGGAAVVNHPVVGELHLHRDKLPVDGVLLVLYYADQGSASDEKLRMLASLTDPDRSAERAPR